MVTNHIILQTSHAEQALLARRYTYSTRTGSLHQAQLFNVIIHYSYRRPDAQLFLSHACRENPRFTAHFTPHAWIHNGRRQYCMPVDELHLVCTGKKVNNSKLAPAGALLNCEEFYDILARNPSIISIIP